MWIMRWFDVFLKLLKNNNEIPLKWFFFSLPNLIFFHSFSFSSSTHIHTYTQHTFPISIPLSVKRFKFSIYNIIISYFLLLFVSISCFRSHSIPISINIFHFIWNNYFYCPIVSSYNLYSNVNNSQKLQSIFYLWCKPYQSQSTPHTYTYSRNANKMGNEKYIFEKWFRCIASLARPVIQFQEVCLDRIFRSWPSKSSHSL